MGNATDKKIELVSEEGKMWENTERGWEGMMNKKVKREIEVFCQTHI